MFFKQHFCSTDMCPFITCDAPVTDLLDTLVCWPAEELAGVLAQFVQAQAVVPDLEPLGHTLRVTHPSLISHLLLLKLFWPTVGNNKFHIHQWFCLPLLTNFVLKSLGIVLQLPMITHVPRRIMCMALLSPLVSWFYIWWLQVTQTKPSLDPCLASAPGPGQPGQNVANCKYSLQHEIEIKWGYNVKYYWQLEQKRSTAKKGEPLWRGTAWNIFQIHMMCACGALLELSFPYKLQIKK